MSKHLILALAVGLFGCAIAAPAHPASVQIEPIIGLPCDGCDEVYIGFPADLEARTRIAPEDAGEALQIEGIVRDASGTPSAGIIVYAYHTDARGIYPNAQRSRGASGSRHGNLRGWARTDDQGRYRFDTIRPASYPNTTIPQHVHMHIIEPGCCSYYIADIQFTDDPLLSERARQRQSSGRGGIGLVTPIKDAAGTWQVTRDIVLGEGISGYAEARN